MTHPTRSALRYFALVYLLSAPWWAVSRFVAFKGLPDNLPVTDVGATFMPMLAGVILVHREEGMVGVKMLLARVFDWRKINNARWLLTILLLMPAIYVLTYFAMRAAQLAVPSHWDLTLGIAFAFPAFLFAATGEEVGYTGYMTDALQRRHSALVTALIIGVPWALWHLPSMIQIGQTLGLVAWGLAATVAYRVIDVWLYNNSGRSLFAIILVHALSNTGRTAFPGGRAAFELADAAIGYGIVICLAVAVAIVYGPKTLRRA